MTMKEYDEWREANPDWLNTGLQNWCTMYGKQNRLMDSKKSCKRSKQNIQRIFPNTHNA